MPAPKLLTETRFADLKLLHRGKVRDVYEVDRDQILLVATDRLSAFDCVLPTPIPFKGQVLTQISRFWFERLQHISANHLLTTDLQLMPERIRKHPELNGRSMLARRTKVFAVECVVRGFLAGSGWKDYVSKRSICGHELPAGLAEAERLPNPIFTPATKAKSGHDENIDEIRFSEIVGVETAAKLRETSLRIYREASEYALTRGIIIADTKFEFGLDDRGNILLIDEVLTPDSSRFWPQSEYRTGISPPSFDKQFVRDYLETLDWNKQPPAPPLPDEIVRATSDRYLEAYRRLTGKELPD